jgi:hypothetical protein
MSNIEYKKVIETIVIVSIRCIAQDLQRISSFFICENVIFPLYYLTIALYLGTMLMDNHVNVNKKGNIHIHMHIGNLAKELKEKVKPEKD